MLPPFFYLILSSPTGIAKQYKPAWLSVQFADSAEKYGISRSHSGKDTLF
jgi:hypothetical protein